MKYDRGAAPNRFARRTLETFSCTLFAMLEEKRFEDISASEL